jgi:hypothetical protein
VPPGGGGIRRSNKRTAESVDNPREIMEATLSTLRIYIYFLAQNRNTFPTRVPIQNLTLRRIQVVNNNKNIIFPIKIKITILPIYLWDAPIYERRKRNSRNNSI